MEKLKVECNLLLPRPKWRVEIIVRKIKQIILLDIILLLDLEFIIK